MKNKKKWIIRIVAAGLALLMFGGIVIGSFANATDIKETSPLVPYEDTDDFAWSEDGGAAVIKLKTPGKTIIRLADIPYGLDNDEIYAFIAAIETKEVKALKFEKKYGYAVALPLRDGHYALYANDLGWTSKDGYVYSVNNGELFCFSVGKVSSNANSYLFTHVEDVANVGFGTFADGYTVIKYNEKFVPNEAYSTYLFDNSFKDIPQTTSGLSQFDNTVKPDESVTETTASGEGEVTTTKKESGSSGSLILSALKDSAVLIIAFVVCAIAYFIIKRKKGEQLSEQLDMDKYDEHRVE